MSSYYDEPNDSSGPLSNPRTVTIIVLAVAALVGIVGCIALYFFVGGNRGAGNGQATQVVVVTSQPSLTPSLTPIPTDTPVPEATNTQDGSGGGGSDTSTPDISATLANIGGSRVATLDELRGLIQIRTTPDGTFQTVLSNVAVAPGTTILSSENSSTRVTTSEGSIIRVSSQTQVSLTDLSGTSVNPVTTLTLDFGKVWTIVGGPLGTGKFEVVTPIGKAAILGSWMSVEHNSTEQIDIVTCLEGKCRYSNENGVQEMETGQQLIVKAGEPLPDPEKMDAAQVADWAITKVPEVITLTPTVTPTFTASATRTPTMTRTPRNTPNVQATSDKSGINTSVAQTSTSLAGANSLTQAANANNSTSTQNAANATATVFFFNATSTAFYNSTQNSFTATSFAFTATSFAATSRFQATQGVLTATAVAQQNTAAAATVTANWVNGQASQVAGNATGTATALTATEAAIPYVNFDPASYATAVPESAGQVTLTIRIAHPVSSNVNLLANFTSVGVNGSAAATGNATLGNDGAHDFVNTQIPFFIPANQSTTTIVVPIADDGFAETNETFQVTLACSGPCNGGAVIGVNLTSTVTIVNSSAPSVSFSSGSPSVPEGDTDSNGTIQVTLSRAYANTNTVSVNYGILAGGTATGGASCGYPTDYVTSLTDDDGGSPGILNFPVGTTSRNITIPICGDTINEGNETIFLQLTSPSNASLGTGSATVTIVDNDPVPTISISPTTVNVTEPHGFGTTTQNFTVSLSAVSGQTITVQYSTTPNNATQGSDYQGISGTLTFMPGSTTPTGPQPSVTINGDQLYEPNETFVLGLSSPTNATLSVNSSSTVTIADNGDVSPPTINYSAVPYQVAKPTSGSTNVTITVNFDRVTGEQVVLFYSTQNGGGQCGTLGVPAAQSGVDYTPTSGSLTFQKDTDISKTFTVTILSNAGTGNKCVGLNLSLSQGSGTLNVSTVPSALVITSGP